MVGYIYNLSKYIEVLKNNGNSLHRKLLSGMTQDDIDLEDIRKTAKDMREISKNLIKEIDKGDK